MCVYKKCKWLYFTILFTLLDSIIKYGIRAYFQCGELLCVLPGINLCYVENSGLAFGLFSYIGIYYKWMLIWLIILLIMIFIVFLFKCRLIYDSWAYSLIIGGSIGNLCDRIVYEEVLDYIDIYVGQFHWPAFNIADIEICMGMMILIIKGSWYLGRN